MEDVCISSPALVYISSLQLNFDNHCTVILFEVFAVNSCLWVYTEGLMKAVRLNNMVTTVDWKTQNNELKKCLQGDLTPKNLRLNHFVSLHLMKM